MSGPKLSGDVLFLNGSRSRAENLMLGMMHFRSNLLTMGLVTIAVTMYQRLNLRR
jgi:hypothetical protein